MADKAYGDLIVPHTSYVNGSPQVFAVCVAACRSESASWRRILVSGLNGGGRAYFALDVTNPLSPQLLWEFDANDNRHLGLTYGKASAVTLSNGSWVILVGSGYEQWTLSGW